MSPEPENVEPPRLVLGNLVDGGLAPAVYVGLDRGLLKRPEAVRGLRAEVELRTTDDYPPVRVVFGDDVILVEDGDAESPDLVVKGSIADLVHLFATPTIGMMPDPTDRRGRAAIGMMLSGSVSAEGSLGLMRKLNALMRM